MTLSYKSIVKFLVIGAIVAVVFARLYRVVDFYAFGIDEEVLLFHSWEQVKDFHPIWIGVSVFQANYYLGPALVYLTALFLKISQGGLSILAYAAAFTGLITTYLIYYCGQTITGSKKIALIAALLYGGSTWVNFFDRLYWNPSFIPLLTILTIYALVKLPHDKRYVILLGVLYGAYLHVHISLCILAPIIGIVVLKYVRTIPKKYLLLAILGYVIMTSPLMVFDYYHKYDNILMPYRMLMKDKKVSIPHDPTNTIASHVRVGFEALGRFWYLDPPKNILVKSCQGIMCELASTRNLFSIGCLILIIWALIKSKRSQNQLILWSVVGIYTLGFVFFPGYPLEYYLKGLFTVLPYIFAQSLARVNKYLLFVIMGAFLIVNVYAVVQSNRAENGLTARTQLVTDTVEALHGAPYILETDLHDGLTYNNYGGWRYIFNIYGYTPVSSSADPVYSWIYKNEMSSTKPQYRVVISDAKAYKTDVKPLAQFAHGIYRSYISPYESR
jgi:hypothetical protein